MSSPIGFFWVASVKEHRDRFSLSCFPLGYINVEQRSFSVSETGMLRKRNQSSREKPS